MEVNFKIIVWMLGILFTGLTAGLCFTWSNAITPGIGRLDDYGFLQSFQAMNQAIINPSFLIVFFGPVILLFVNAFLYRSAHPATFWSFMLAAVLFFLGISLVTIFKNVPLNELLDKTVLEKATPLELADLRKTFEEPWNKWHTVRTVCATFSFILLLTGIIVNK